MDGKNDESYGFKMIKKEFNVSLYINFKLSVQVHYDNTLSKENIMDGSLTVKI